MNFSISVANTSRNFLWGQLSATREQPLSLKGSHFHFIIKCEQKLNVSCDSTARLNGGIQGGGFTDFNGKVGSKFFFFLRGRLAIPVGTHEPELVRFIFFFTNYEKLHRKCFFARTSVRGHSKGVVLSIFTKNWVRKFLQNSSKRSRDGPQYLVKSGDDACFHFSWE